MAGQMIPWFKMYAAETLSDERFQGWSVDERGAWITLLLVAWREGSIPGDQTSLGRLLHVDSSAMRLLWSAIGDRFVPHPDHPGRLTSPRLEIERERAEALTKRKSAAGLKGAKSRWAKVKSEHDSRMRLPSPEHGTDLAGDGWQDRAGQETINNTHTPAQPSPREQGAADRVAILTPRPLTASLLAELECRGFECGFAAKATTSASIERALGEVGVPVAADRVMLAVNADRRMSVIPHATLGWYLDAIRGQPEGGRRASKQSNPQTGVATPADASAFGEGGQRAIE